MRKIIFAVCSLCLVWLAGCENPSNPGTAMSTKDVEGRNVIVDPISGRVQVIDQSGNVAKVLNQSTDSGGKSAEHKGH